HPARGHARLGPMSTPDLPDPLRRRLLAGGGALVAGLSLAPLLRAAQPGPQVPGADAAEVDTWLAIHADNTATLYIGFAELGQGATTALLQVAAEELDLDMDQMHAAPLHTHLSPNQGGMYSSASVQRGRPQVAGAAAHARAALLDLAAAQLSAPVTTLSVERGEVFVRDAPARRVTYGALLGGQPFRLRTQGNPPLKEVSRYRLVGQPQPRADLRSRVDGTHP